MSAATAGSRRRPRLERAAAAFGVTSSVVICLGCLWSALGYAGTGGESYSLLNHWISELGQEDVAARAGWFNLALIVGGAGFAAFVLGLAWTSPSRLRWVFGLVGVLAGIGGLFVGVFPMNHADQHIVAASTFFNLGWILVALASIAFVRHREPRHPAWLAIVGAISVAAFIAFLVALRSDEFSRQRTASSGAITGRPDVWIAPVLEWATLVGITVWVLLASVAWLRQLRREAAVTAT